MNFDRGKYIIKDKKKKEKKKEEKEKREKFYGSPWRQRKLFESPIYVTRDWFEILILFHSGLRSERSAI